MKWWRFLVIRALSLEWSMGLSLSIASMASAVATTRTFAADVIEVAACSLQRIPVVFDIDCSHVKDAATKQLCGPFVQNQACKVFPAYRKITGIKLEQRCAKITYTIYDKDNWPHGHGGGQSYKCQIDHMAEYAILQWAHSKIGPYEVHELLHHYQMSSKELAGLTAAHPLFSPSMAEAQREVGDVALHDQFLRSIRDEVPKLRAQLQTGSVKASARCGVARTIVANEAYLDDSKNVYRFYSKLASVAPRNLAERDAQFDRMLGEISGEKAKAFLSANGCTRF